MSHLQFGVAPKGQFTGKHREQWVIVDFGGEKGKGAYTTCPTFSLRLFASLLLRIYPLFLPPISPSFASFTFSSSFYYMEKSCDHLLILKSSAAPLYYIRIFILNKCKALPEKASGEFHFFRLTTFGSSQINRELQFEPLRSVHTPTPTPVGVVG